MHTSGWSVALLVMASAAMAVHLGDLATAATTASSRSAATLPTATRPRQAPKIETIEHNSGNIWAGDSVKHAFEVTNTSERVMEIRSVNTTCGCTTASKWEKEVLPGQTWTLDVTFATAGRQGKVNKSITVMTDDPDRPRIELVLKGEIQTRFEVSPSQAISLGALQSDSVIKRTLSITNKLPEPVVFTLGKAGSNVLKTELREVDKGKRYELDVETVPPLSEATSFDSIVLQTGLKEPPELAIPVSGRVQARVALAPKVIAVCSPALQDTYRNVQLRLADGTKASITGVESSAAAISTAINPPTTTQPQHIRVSIPKGTELPAKGATLTVHTDDPEFPVLTCEIRPFRFGRGGGSQPVADTQPAVRAAAGVGGLVAPAIQVFTSAAPTNR